MRQFKASALFITEAKTDHFPAGTLLAQGEDGLYILIGPMNNFDYDTKRDPASWPFENGSLTLFRDHWNYFCDNSNRDHGVYFLQLMDAPKTQIKP
jgi:hypothetical protein